MQGGTKLSSCCAASLRADDADSDEDGRRRKPIPGWADFREHMWKWRFKTGNVQMRSTSSLGWARCSAILKRYLRAKVRNGRSWGYSSATGVHFQQLPILTRSIAPPLVQHGPFKLSLQQEMCLAVSTCFAAA